MQTIDEILTGYTAGRIPAEEAKELLRQHPDAPLPSRAQVTDAWHARNDNRALELQRQLTDCGGLS